MDEIKIVLDGEQVLRFRPVGYGVEYFAERFPKGAVINNVVPNDDGTYTLIVSVDDRRVEMLPVEILDGGPRLNVLDGGRE